MLSCAQSHAFALFSDLTEPIDIYSEWIDAADAAQREEQSGTAYQATPSSRSDARARMQSTLEDDGDD